MGLSKLVSPGGRRTLRSLASQGLKKFKNSTHQVIFVRSDSTPTNSSSSSSASPPPLSSKTLPRSGGYEDCGSEGRRQSRGINGGHDDREKRNHEYSLKTGLAAGDGKADPPLSLSETAAAGAGTASCRRHSSSGSSSRRKSRRVACIDGQGHDNRWRIEHSGHDSGTDGVGDAVEGRGSSNGGRVTASAVGVRKRIQPMLAYHILLGIVVRGMQWAGKKKGRP